MVTPSAIRCRLSVKFALLVAGIFGLALVVLFFFQRMQRESLRELQANEARERAGMLTRVVGMTGQSLRDFTYDYSQWDDLVRFVANPRRRWAAINLDASLGTFNLWAVWVLRPDGSVVHATRGENAQGPAPDLPFDEAELSQVISAGKAGECFVLQRERLLGICYAPVLRSKDTAGHAEPQGWLIAARLWDAALLQLISEVIQCEAAIVGPADPLPAPQDHAVSQLFALRGLSGAPAANLVYTLRANELEIVARAQRAEFIFIAGAFIAAALALTLLVYRWVVRPLNVVSASLPTRDAQAIEPLLARRDEIGGVAQAVKRSFEQRAELERMFEDRMRLGRELHDGVIQTVYAAGMNLAGARAVLRTDPSEAERILDDTRAELNDSIRSLRDFIRGLDPEPRQHRSFQEAVLAIVKLMQGVRPVKSMLTIDNDVVTTLNAHQRLHLLQIIREAVSNSVRHGRANNLAIRLGLAPEGMVLEIEDDGIGLERTPNLTGGHGLANFATRARELGGEVHMSAVPTGGLCVRVVVPAGNVKLTDDGPEG